MSIFKRGRVYWYHFVFSGAHILAAQLPRDVARLSVLRGCTNSCTNKPKHAE